MKKVILISLLWVGALHSQSCMDDMPRIGTYSIMEVYNHSTGKYEKYRKAKEVRPYVIIDSEAGVIHFLDSLNNYNKKFRINDCEMKEDSLIYFCTDIAHDKKCRLIFCKDKSMTVVYNPEPVIYRVR